MKELTITETQLFNESGEPEAISVSLDELLNFIKKCFPNLDASVHYEDYDDYGCEHYIIIRGECADIQLKKDYGGLFYQEDNLVCSVILHSVRDKSTFITHSFYFKEGMEHGDVVICSDYVNQIKKYLNSTVKYLIGNSTLFYRVDTRRYNDGRGVHKVPDVITPYSYDLIHVSDEDFYTDKELRTDIKSCKEDIDEIFEARCNQDRYIFNTPVGHILVESPLSVEFCPEADFYDNYESPWIATHVVNEEHPKIAKGKTLREAYNQLFDELAQYQKKISWHSQMINSDKKREFGVVLGMRKDGKFHSPGEKLYIKLVATGETEKQAVAKAFDDRSYSVRKLELILSDLKAGRTNDLVAGYSMHSLSDIAIDYFSDERIYYDDSIVLVDGVIEKESRMEEGTQMSREEWASHRALDDE